MVKKEYIERHELVGPLIFAVVCFVLLLTAIFYNDSRLDDLEENRHYKPFCTNETIKGFINYPDIEEVCGSSIVTVSKDYTIIDCEKVIIIDDTWIPEDQYYCENGICYYSYEKETCGIREITQSSGNAKEVNNG